MKKVQKETDTTSVVKSGFDNLLASKEFQAEKNVPVWVTGIFDIKVKEKNWDWKVYIVMDVHSNLVLDIRVKEEKSAHHIIDSLKKAMSEYGYEKGTIVHSRSGDEYCSDVYMEFLKSHGLRGSMSTEKKLNSAEAMLARAMKDMKSHMGFA